MRPVPVVQYKNALTIAEPVIASDPSTSRPGIHIRNVP